MLLDDEKKILVMICYCKPPKPCHTHILREEILRIYKKWSDEK